MLVGAAINIWKLATYTVAIDTCPLLNLPCRVGDTEHLFCCPGTGVTAIVSERKRHKTFRRSQL